MISDRSVIPFCREEINAGAEVLIHKMKIYRPKIIAFNGRGQLTIDGRVGLKAICCILGIYEVYAGNKHFHYGKQPEPFPGTDTVSIPTTLFQ